MSNLKGFGTCITVVPIHNYFLNILLLKQLPRIPESGVFMDHRDHSTCQSSIGRLYRPEVPSLFYIKSRGEGIFRWAVKIHILV